MPSGYRREHAVRIVTIDAIVLSGGASRRLGRDKLIESVGQRQLLARVADALLGVQRVVVVGRAPSVGRYDVVVQEDPPGAGPIAALVRGLAEVHAPVVLTLAGDLPFLTPQALRVLTDAVTITPGLGAIDLDGIDLDGIDLDFTDLDGIDPDGIDPDRIDANAVGPDVAVAVDDDGRDQYLLAAWRTAALRTALTTLGRAHGVRLGTLFDGSVVQRVRLTGHPPPWWDCDTDADLVRARFWSEGSEG